MVYIFDEIAFDDLYRTACVHVHMHTHCIAFKKTLEQLIRKQILLIKITATLKCLPRIQTIEMIRYI